MNSQPFDLQAVACKVYSALTDFPESRDDDKVLLSTIWVRELGDKESNIKDFFTEFLSGHLSNPETITRVRRKLQEKHEKLRGEKWEIRHKMEGAVCQQLTFFDNW